MERIPEKLNIEVEWKNVQKEMDYNINHYWKAKVKKPYLFLTDEWVEFTVSTLARILVTLEEKEIVSKAEGLKRAAVLVHSHWEPLLEEAALSEGKSECIFL